MGLKNGVMRERVLKLTQDDAIDVLRELVHTGEVIYHILWCKYQISEQGWDDYHDSIEDKSVYKIIRVGIDLKKGMFKVRRFSERKWCKELQEHMSKGLTRVAAYAKMGVSKTNGNNKETKYPKLKEAADIGAGLYQLFWEEKGINDKQLNNVVWKTHLDSMIKKAATDVNINADVTSKIEVEFI